MINNCVKLQKKSMNNKKTSIKFKFHAHIRFLHLSVFKQETNIVKNKNVQMKFLNNHRDLSYLHIIWFSIWFQTFTPLESDKKNKQIVLFWLTMVDKNGKRKIPIAWEVCDWDLFWYSKRDSNPHSRDGQGILSPSCLPFHHSSNLYFFNWKAHLLSASTASFLQQRCKGNTFFWKND